MATKKRSKKKVSIARGKKKARATRGKKRAGKGRGKKKARKKAGRRYSKAASKKVEAAMHERKHGQLRSGRSGRKVKSRAQAVAIGLSEARRSGAKVPPPPGSKKKKRRSS